ncbi:MAG TPA: two-component regulator propeller domain-containing protein [Bacteroidales bacterium]|nr:two-component regulator propeller domain-containing protein [Bacteroidales bacterium]
MSTRLRSFLFVILLLPLQYAASQDFVTDIESYTVASGLSQTTINTVFQDSRGFLWIGTQGGLNRFDGYNFKVFTPQIHKKNTISSSYVTCITEDKKGNLWIGTKNGLNKYNYNDDSFTAFTHDNGDQLSIALDEIQSLYFDKKGNFWIKTPETLERMDVSTGHFFHYPYFSDIFNYNSDKVSYPILEDNAGKLWVGTKDGLNYLDRSLLLFDRFAQNKNFTGGWSRDIISAMILTSKDELLIGTNNGLFLFDRNTHQFLQPDYLKKLNGKKIFALLEDKTGHIWIGSEHGIEIYNRATNTVEELELSDKKDIDALNAQVISLFQDRSGIVWVGTNRGLIKVNVKARKFKLLSKNSSPKLSLTSDDIASIYLADKNTLWIGTWGDGLNIVDITTNKLKKFSFTSNEGNSDLNYIHSIYRDRKRNYWLGTRDGVLLFDPAKGEAKSLCDVFKIEGCLSLRGVRVSQIIEDDYGNLWFATYFGLIRFNSAKNELKSLIYSPEDSGSLPSNINYCLRKDRKGFFWIGTDKGLVKFDPITGKVLKKSRTLIQDNFSGSATIYSIEIDEVNKVIWAGSENGLIRFDMNCNITGMFTEEENISGNIIYSVFKDNQSNLWLSTNRGISKFNTENESVVNYDISDGLQNYEFNLGASYKHRDGSLYFGGISGINIILPDSMAKDNSVPNIVVTYIEIINKNGEHTSIKAKDNQIILPYGTSLLSLDFAALDFAFPSKNQFKYKFYSGDEGDWINLGNRNTATFTNLKPGKYTFKLIGSNSDLTWNQQGIEYTIIVESPFWLTTLAFYLYAIVAGLLFFTIYQFRTTQFHKTNKLLKQQETITGEMQRQKEELSVKNKNITDSINYAKRIQEALMPSERQILKAFPNSFVLLKPKDIVSGDFFWISERNNKIFVAAIDCTGHGVPGAFMSIIGYELFRKITSNENIDSAAEMLTLLNREFETLFKDVQNFTLRDGMDIAFVIIDKANKKLEFSGAINPMYIIRNNKVKEIRGSRFSIGLEENDDRDQSFESSIVDLEPDDIFYLFSDGYADQFGGPEGKKFKYRRFRHLLLTIHKFPMEEQQQLLEERLESWKGNLEQVDDILIIGIKPSV